MLDKGEPFRQVLADYGRFYGTDRLLPIHTVYTGTGMDPGAGGHFLEQARNERLKFRANVVLSMASLDLENYGDYLFVSDFMFGN